MTQIGGYRRHRAALTVMAIALGMAISHIGEALAQEPLPPDTLVGRVVQEGQPLPSVPVVLHRVTPQSSGEVAAATTDESGTFRLPLETLEGAGFNIFFVTAEYLSVRYFGEPVHPDRPRVGYTVAVYDTVSSPSVPPRVNRRDFVMIPQTNDSWEVNEIISILNPGDRAIVGAQGMPTMEISVPTGALDFQAGEGDIFPHELSFMGGRVLLVTPVIPGRRDLWLRYRLPPQPARATVRIQQPTDTFNLYVQQPSHLTGVEGLGTTQMINVEGEQFLQYGAIDLPAGATIALRWTGGAPVDPVVAAVVVTLALLAAGAVVAARNRRAGAAA
ncbi:MAG TPA: carboxypeptidase-like regulatory domain-containing protein [Longimicrobiaceae bacterium]|nr:carboxypeptidase-like regulatory domain-containing protein [Longimicrobiaceae bacterium]